MPMAPRAWVPPTAPLKVAWPVPRTSVRPRVWPASLLTVLLKVSAALLVVSVRSPPLRVTAPVYICVPVLVTFAPMLAAPLTVKLLRLVYSPSTSAAPVMVSALAPPFKVLWVLIVEPVSVVFAPSVIASP